jgi:hypothetical protein
MVKVRYSEGVAIHTDPESYRHRACCTRGQTIGSTGSDGSNRSRKRLASTAVPLHTTHRFTLHSRPTSLQEAAFKLLDLDPLRVQ